MSGLHSKLRAPGAPEMEVSRRRLLGAACVVAAGAAAVPICARAGSKVSQREAHYQASPKGEARCGRCKQFSPPSSCSLVDGPVSPSGWCSFFAAK